MNDNNIPCTLVDWQIDEYASQGMIIPFVNQKQTFAGTSYGLSSVGYDIRLGNSFVSLKTRESTNFDRIILMPNESILGVSMEYFDMPQNIFARLYNKSTNARLFISQPATIIEPEWKGYLTLEITNLSSNAISLTAGMGIAQIVFERTLMPRKTYGNGKYQDQPQKPIMAITNFKNI